MKATEQNVRAVPVQFRHHSQICNWTLKDTIDETESVIEIFQERTYTPWMKAMHSEYWLDGWQLTEEQLLKNIASLGLNPDLFVAQECFYGPGYFPITEDFQTALDYFNRTTGREEITPVLSAPSPTAAHSTIPDSRP